MSSGAGRRLRPRDTAAAAIGAPEPRLTPSELIARAAALRERLRAEAVLVHACEHYMDYCRRWAADGTPFTTEDSLRLWLLPAAHIRLGRRPHSLRAADGDVWGLGCGPTNDPPRRRTPGTKGNWGVRRGCDPGCGVSP
jgi:hypothetical protein